MRVLKYIHVGMICGGIVWGSCELFNELYDKRYSNFSIVSMTCASLIGGIFIGGVAGLLYPITVPALLFHNMRKNKD